MATCLIEFDCTADEKDVMTANPYIMSTEDLIKLKRQSENSFFGYLAIFWDKTVHISSENAISLSYILQNLKYN